MAFTRILGPGIHTASNINSHNINSTGIITAVSFVGNLTGGASSITGSPHVSLGNINAGIATFTGALTGTTANFTIDVNNDGNAPDTILLDVDAEPDLVGFWANYSNSSSNHSNNTSPTVEVPEDVLMYGNSFIYTNNMEVILADLFDSVGEHNSTVAKTAGSLTLEDHWDSINTSGDSWNTTLRNSGHDWDFVVLQDQSQIPGLDRTDQDWITSKDSGVLIADAVEQEGSQVMLMMTWGYLAADPLNPIIYSNYTNMQERLRQGYVDFHDNMTTPSRDVWIAPVGLGFANIYHTVKNSGGTPEAPGSAFHNLLKNRDN